jgi:hypothetical protein
MALPDPTRIAGSPSTRNPKPLSVEHGMAVDIVVEIDVGITAGCQRAV